MSIKITEFFAYSNCSLKLSLMTIFEYVMFFQIKFANCCNSQYNYFDQKNMFLECLYECSIIICYLLFVTIIKQNTNISNTIVLIVLKYCTYKV